MSRFRHQLLMVTATAALLACPRLAAAQPRVDVGALRDHVGQTVVVSGKAISLLTAEETPLERVYLLRGEHGGEVRVLTTQPYPHQGSSLTVTGTVSLDPIRNRLLIRESRRCSLCFSWTFVGSAVGVSILGGLSWMIVVRRRRARPDVSHASTVWGHAVIIAGPDQGKRFALSRERVELGRNLDPGLAVTLSDPQVSREHGVIIRRDGSVQYQDTGSRNGSWVDDQRVALGGSAALGHGALLKLGGRTVVRIDLRRPSGEATAASTEEVPQEQMTRYGPQSKDQR